MSMNKYISKNMSMKKYMSYNSKNGSTNKHISDISQNYVHEIYLQKISPSRHISQTSLETMHIKKYISKKYVYAEIHFIYLPKKDPYII